MDLGISDLAQFKVFGGEMEVGLEKLNLVHKDQGVLVWWPRTSSQIAVFLGRESVEAQELFSSINRKDFWAFGALQC